MANRKHKDGQSISCSSPFSHFIYGDTYIEMSELSFCSTTDVAAAYILYAQTENCLPTPTVNREVLLVFDIFGQAFTSVKDTVLDNSD